MTEATFQRLGGPTLLRRVAAFLTMLGILYAVRHLALLFVSFVLFAAMLDWAGKRLAPLLGDSHRRGVLAVLAVLGAALAVLAYLGYRVGHQYVLSLIADGVPLTQRLTALQADLLQRVPSWVDVDDLKEKVPELVAPAIVYARTTGRLMLELLIGLILAVVYLLDRDEVDAMVKSAPVESFAGDLRRYFGHLRDALIITVQLQVLVALVNTVLTMPVLLVLRLPHVVAFTVVIFFSSLIPVVGNLLSGAVLITASYLYKGPLAVVGFLGTTFILHKIEAYYLNPRLTARHVHLPALVLIISLILFEHVFGLVGLFLSFPSLYLGIKISQDFRDAQALLLASVASQPKLVEASAPPVEPA